MKLVKLSFLLALITIGLLALFLTASGQAVLATKAEPLFAQEAKPVSENRRGKTAGAPASANFVAETDIIVDSGGDPDTSDSKTCLSDSPCTLRRAIVQANQAKPAARTVAIIFNLSKSDGSYNSQLAAWEIKPQAGSGAAAFPTLIGGSIAILGSSQGDVGTHEADRDEGPLVILVGPGNGSKDGIILGRDESGADDENIVEGIAFQNFRNHIVVNSNGNDISENWFGLTGDGQSVSLRDGGDPKRGSGEIGVSMGVEVSENRVYGNILAGFSNVAIAVRGENSTVDDNKVGINAFGEVPGAQTSAVAACSSGDWLGGGGISVDGNDNSVTGNTLAGLRQQNDDTSQPAAVRVRGENHRVDDNFIGESEHTDLYVCGNGIKLEDGPVAVTIADNVIVNSSLSALSLNGSQYDGNDLTGNLIRRENPWTAGETAVQLGSTLPKSLKEFLPAQVTLMSGTMVKGTSGAGSECPNCRIELFLDDRDNIEETLAAQLIKDDMAIVADANGNWQAVLKRPLTTKEGLRTMSTTAAGETIPGLGADTTTALSVLYIPEKENSFVFLPVVQG